MERMSASMTSTLENMPSEAKAGRLTRGPVHAIRRRIRLASREVSTPRRGDFEHGVLRYIAEGSDNLLGKTVAGEECCPTWLVLRTARGDDLRHVDLFSLGIRLAGWPVCVARGGLVPQHIFHHIVRPRKAGLAQEGFMNIAFELQKVCRSQKPRIGRCIGALPRPGHSGHQSACSCLVTGRPSWSIRRPWCAASPFLSMTSTASLPCDGRKPVRCAVLFIECRNTSIATLFTEHPPEIIPITRALPLFSRAVLEATKILGVPNISLPRLAVALVPVLCHHLCGRPGLPRRGHRLPSTHGLPRLSA